MRTPEHPTEQRPVPRAEQRAEQQKEALSAFVDAEADDLERRRVAATLLDDDETRATFARYQLIGAVMRGETVIAARASEREAERLRAALARETAWSREADMADATADESSRADLPLPAPAIAAVAAVAAVPERPRASRRWYAAGLGLATAAGLAAGMFFGGPVPNAPAQPMAAVAPAGGQLATASAGIETRQRAQRYMLLHAQQSSLGQSVQGIPLVKYVVFETQAH